MEKIVKINSDFIKLDSFLKFVGAVNSGGEAKIFIKDGKVKVNGNIECQRGKKLHKDDCVEFNGNKYILGDQWN